jgi:hypothetical protein
LGAGWCVCFPSRVECVCCSVSLPAISCRRASTLGRKTWSLINLIANGVLYASILDLIRGQELLGMTACRERCNTAAGSLQQQVAASQQFMTLRPTSKRFGPSLQSCTLDLKNCDHGLTYHSSRAEHTHRRVSDSPMTATSKTSTGTARTTTHRESASSAEERALAHFQEVGEALWYPCVSRPRGYHLDNCRRLRDGEEPT